MYCLNKIRQRIKKMKTMKNISTIALLLVFFTAVSCKDSKTNSKESEPEVVTIDNRPDQQEVYAVADGDVVFKDKDVAKIFNKYIQLQNALINTDGQKGQEVSLDLLNQITISSIEDTEEVEGILTTMSQTDEIEMQRRGFENISSWIVETIEGNIESGTVYRQYCPMAFNDRGAYWVSTDKKILNPYFGDKMLRCGRVETEIR